MIYTELEEKILGVEAKNFQAEMVLRERLIQSLPDDERMAYRIIRLLLRRKGFEGWWNPHAADGMPAECNDEIFETMKQIIRERGMTDKR